MVRVEFELPCIDFPGHVFDDDHEYCLLDLMVFEDAEITAG